MKLSIAVVSASLVSEENIEGRSVFMTDADKITFELDGARVTLLESIQENGTPKFEMKKGGDDTDYQLVDLNANPDLCALIMGKDEADPVEPPVTL